jgi:hypothetical protein
MMWLDPQRGQVGILILLLLPPVHSTPLPFEHYPLHHRAYDQALITVWDDYSIRLNEGRIMELKQAGEAEGLDSFSQGLRSKILLPPVISDYPHVEYIRIANRIRSWNP